MTAVMLNGADAKGKQDVFVKKKQDASSRAVQIPTVKVIECTLSTKSA